MLVFTIHFNLEYLGQTVKRNSRQHMIGHYEKDAQSRLEMNTVSALDRDFRYNLGSK